jgi:hypothetical protein
MSDPRDTCPCIDDRNAQMPVGSAVCACGHPLMPIGTKVRWLDRESGQVASWARQTCGTLPVTFAPGEYALVSRADVVEVA